MLRATDVGDGRIDGRRCDVYRDADGPVGVHGIGGGVRPAPAGDLGGLVNEARLFQTGHDLCGGGLGETGELADTVAGESTMVEQQRQRGAVVDGAEPAGGALGVLACHDLSSELVCRVGDSACESCTRVLFPMP